MDKRNQNGFTLYELLITMVIVGVVLTFGVPNMLAFNQNGRMTSAANDLHSSFHLARSESGRAKTNITVCASANALATTANCGGTWDQGFIVFVDEDGDINRSGANETVLQAHGPVAEGITIAVADDATYFSYSSNGLGRPNVGGNPAVSQIVMCDERGVITSSGGSSAARLFVATPLGRATVFRDNTLINDALTAMGKSCP
ncbi:MAG: GspH/FimT family pseudopilin [Gammaproteobacteria bacterium]|nr:GspH/FimT family pseudopilin [Gammaproteobacteria bacterium]MDH5617425.1 GspH/FimT family pseudopilin [Gammaproteobacteria bacterium]